MYVLVLLFVFLPCFFIFNENQYLKVSFFSQYIVVCDIVMVSTLGQRLVLQCPDISWFHCHVVITVKLFTHVPHYQAYSSSCTDAVMLWQFATENTSLGEVEVVSHFYFPLQTFFQTYNIFCLLGNKSPAVARVSRPYTWCALATCVHNCPSMMFRTCCLRPKCKLSYLLFYITSGSYVNKLCKQVKRPIPPRNTCVANCGQTAAVSDMVTIDSL